MSVELMSRPQWNPVSLDDVLAAQERTRGVVTRTPLVRLDADDIVPPGTEIWLKLENLQPVRAYKLRGAWNSIASLSPDQRAAGVWTVSAGNMAQALAWSARRMGIPCMVVMPLHAPQTKVDNVRRYGGKVVQLPGEEVEGIFVSREYAGASGTMIHPYSNPQMMAGNGVMALELLEDLPELDVVIAPWGGGGLCCGIAPPLRALRPGVRIFASEPATGNPLGYSLAAGHPVSVPYEVGLCDAIAGSFVQPEMFVLAQQLLDGAISVDDAQTAAAIRLVLERNRVVAEGGAATSVAAALTGKAGSGKIVCIVSGGNIDTARLAELLKADG